jgi:hypothetical protein
MGVPDVLVYDGANKVMSDNPLHAQLSQAQTQASQASATLPAQVHGAVKPKGKSQAGVRKDEEGQISLGLPSGANSTVGSSNPLHASTDAGIGAGPSGGNDASTNPIHSGRTMTVDYSEMKHSGRPTPVMLVGHRDQSALKGTSNAAASGGSAVAVKARSAVDV